MHFTTRRTAISFWQRRCCKGLCRCGHDSLGNRKYHWSLDVTFREDANRTRTGKAPKNLVLLRRLALNVVKKDKERFVKKSLKAKRFTALLSTDYLDYLLNINF